jgi:membrane-associated phospholipid phosphatase
MALGPLSTPPASSSSSSSAAAAAAAPPGAAALQSALQSALQPALRAGAALLAASELSVRGDGGELIVTALLLVLGAASSGIAPAATPFVERDPALSQPLRAGGDTVPSSLLFAVAVALPALLAAAGVAAKAALRGGLGGAAAAAAASGGGAPSRRALARSAVWLSLSLLQALGVAWAATGVLKNVVGRQRPSFFALTDYAGYASAVASAPGSEAWSLYMSATSDGSHESNFLGDLSKARADSLVDAQRSFPSGHASLSFAGLGWAVGALRRLAGARPGESLSLRAALCALPLVLAAAVATSRVRDRKHFTDDISVGAAIGAIGAVLAWAHFETDANRRDGFE